MPRKRNELRNIGTCPKCETPNANFSKNQQYCKNCVKREKARYRYGLTPDQYDKVMDRTNCDLCDKDLGYTSKVCIDHDHTLPLNFSYRGTLCIECNTGLGMFNDDIGMLQKAISYLHRHLDRVRTNRGVKYEK